MPYLLLLLAVTIPPLLARSWRRYNRRKARLQAVRGTVLEASVLDKGTFDCYPRVRVSYRFNELEYRAAGPFLEFTPRLWRHDLADMIVRRYPIGSTAMVMVDPAHPWVGYMDPEWVSELEVDHGTFIIPIFAITMVLGGVSALRAGVVLPAVGVVTNGIASWRALRLARASYHWPSVDGEVRWADVEHRHGGKGGGGHAARPSVRYDYRVGDRDFTSHVLFVGSDDWVLSERFAKRLVADYARGDQVKVHYDPANPARAVLIRGETAVARRRLFMALVCLILTPMALWLAAYLES